MHVWADVMRWDCLLEQALFHEKVGGWTYTNVGIVASHLTPVGLSSAGDTTTLGNVLVVVVEKVVILGHDAHHDADGPQYLPMDVVSRHVLFLLLWPVALLAPLWSKARGLCGSSFLVRSRDRRQRKNVRVVQLA